MNPKKQKEIKRRNKEVGPTDVGRGGEENRKRKETRNKCTFKKKQMGIFS